MRFRCTFLILFVLVAAHVSATEEWFDRVSESLTFSAHQNTFRARISGTLDVEAYWVEQPAPGLVFTDESTLLNPRLVVFLDARWGRHLYSFVQVRADRGFDPNADTPHVRLDEYALRWTPVDARLVLQVGQFGTVLGNWMVRHGSWENPFIGAPLPYELVTGISDLFAATSPALFGPPEPEEKYEFNPIIWGPSYASGASVAGLLGRFEYALEIKNASLASRMEAWSLSRVGMERSTCTARVGFRPNLSWSLGFSASDGAYLLPEAQATLPYGHDRGEYRQRLLAHDVSFAWRHLQIWAEVFVSRFDVPDLGVAETRAGYVEAKYKFTPQLYGAVRLNRQVFSRVNSPAGPTEWAHDTSRVDLALGYRFTPFAQLKLQVSHERQAAQPSQLNFALQFTHRL